MIGVVIWSDQEDRKAVFWCEDQGDLAYYEACSDDCDGFGFFDAGDMVQFDVTTQARMRRARNARLLQEQVCAELPDQLRRGAGALPQGRDAPSRSAKIIPFNAPAAPPDHKRKALNA